MTSGPRGRLLRAKLGDTHISNQVLNSILREIDEIEAEDSVLAIMVVDGGDALIATERALLAADKESTQFLSFYEDITAFEAKTGWWSSGIYFSVSEGDFEFTSSDKEAIVAIERIVHERVSSSLGAGSAETRERDGGGLIGRAKGIFNTATGGDLRKYDEFVDASTTALVGLHRDKDEHAARLSEAEAEIVLARDSYGEMAARLEKVERMLEDVRRSQEESDERLRERVLEILREREESGRSRVARIALAASAVAIVLAIISIAMRFAS